ncbi:MAG: carboxypeptidase regulatory-like domain-containing protein [Deltaproteobacteria bacterium]|nr:carboxypeptidase regulatory-like domain-containing protein [Deltaproteobacteria bacterium]
MRGAWLAALFSALIPGAERGVTLRVSVAAPSDESLNGAARRDAVLATLGTHVSHRGVTLLAGTLGPSMMTAALGVGLVADVESSLCDLAASTGYRLLGAEGDARLDATALATPATSGAERVFAALPGFASRWISVGGRLGAAALERESVLEGRVTTPDSLPIPHAVVRAEPRFDGEGAVPSLALTNADGVFRLRGLSAAPVALVVEKAGYAAGGRSELLPGDRADVVLDPVGEVSGVVRSPSGPVQATVTIAGSGLFPPLVTSSGRSGEFALSPIPPGIYWVRAETRTGEASRSVTVEVSPAAPHRTATLNVQPAPRIKGQVVGSDRKGVLGAVVLFSEEELSVFPVASVTAPDGRFSRSLWPARADGGLSVFASVFAPGQPPVRAKSIRVDVGDAGVEIELPPTGAVSGRVTGPSDEPIEAAAIEVTSMSSETGVTIVSDLTVRALTATFAKLGVPYKEMRSFKTDAAGRFHVSGISPGAIAVRATHPLFAAGHSKEASLAEGGLVTLDVRVARASGVAGVVEDAAGRALGGALVRVVDVATRRYEAVMRAHENGAFRLRCGPGRKRVEAVKEPFSGGEVEVVVTARTFKEDVVLRLVAGERRVLGRVLDGADAPVAGAEVALTVERGPLRVRVAPRTTTSDETGRFRFEAVVDGRYAVRVAKDGFPSIVRAGVPLDAEFDLKLVEGGRIVGRVTRDRFRLVDAFTVVTPSGATAQGVDGRFELGPLPAGLHKLRVDADGLVSATEVVSVKVGEASEVEIDLVEGGAVSGEVVSDADGRGVALATVDVGGRVARTDAVGRFRLTGLPMGTATIRVSARNFESLGRETVEIRRGDEVRGLRLVVIPVRNP